MLDAATSAIGVIFTWPNILFLLIGTLVGITFGALPGLGGVVGVALLIPLTFNMDAQPAMLLFASTMGGVAFGGSVSAILINVPGTAPNAATILDGYPMSQQGRAGEALGVAATASALGAIFGLIILILLIPIARAIILAFWAPEFFWLAIFGLTIIAVVTQGPLIKGLAAGGFGLMLSLVGFSGATGEYRYGLGTEYLWDGVNLVVALIGLFALAEIINMSRKGGSIAKNNTTHTNRSDVITGVKEVLRRPTLVIRSSTIGVLVGMIPGAGGTIANFIAYMHVVQISDEPESFGRGNLEGVIAPEAANDAKDGGMLLPTVIFGIPGDATAAVLLGAFVLHGIQPGQQMVGEDLPIFFVIIFGLLFSNILTSTTGLLMADRLMKITLIPVKILIPPIAVVSLVGAFALRGNLLDVFVAVIFGFVGYIMISRDYSRIALVLALILGPIAETSFLQSLMISDGDYSIFVTRPISLALVLLIVASLLLPAIRSVRESKFA